MDLKSSITTIVLIMLCMSASSQEISFDYQNFLGSGLSHDQGFQCSYRPQIWNDHFQMGIEYRSVDWGNQISLSIGFRSHYWDRNQWTIDGISNVYLGLALFYKHSMFAPAVSYTPILRWQSPRRLFLELNLGLRYTVCPSYKKYGTYTQLDFPLGLGVGWNW